MCLPHFNSCSEQHANKMLWFCVRVLNCGKTLCGPKWIEISKDSFVEDLFVAIAGEKLLKQGVLTFVSGENIADLSVAKLRLPLAILDKLHKYTVCFILKPIHLETSKCHKEIDHNNQSSYDAHVIPHPHGQPIPIQQTPAGVPCQSYLVEQKPPHGYHGYSHPPASYPGPHGYVPCRCQACIGSSLRYSEAFQRARSFDTDSLPPRSSNFHPSWLHIPHPTHDQCSHGYFPLYMRPKKRSRPRPKRPMSVHGDVFMHGSGIPFYGPHHSELYGRPQWWGWGSSDEEVYSYPYTATMVTQEHSTTTKQTVTVKTRKTTAQREAMAQKRHTIHGFPGGGFVENQEQMLIQQVMQGDNAGHDNISSDEVFFQPRPRPIQNIYNKQSESTMIHDDRDSAIYDNDDNNNNNNDNRNEWEMIEWERGKDSKDVRVEEYENSSDSLTQETLINSPSRKQNESEEFEKEDSPEISGRLKSIQLINNAPTSRRRSIGAGKLSQSGRKHSCSRSMNRKYSIDSINSATGDSEYESCSSGDDAGVFNLTELRDACQNNQETYNEDQEQGSTEDQQWNSPAGFFDGRIPSFIPDSKSSQSTRNRTTVGTMTEGTSKKNGSTKEDKTAGTSRPKTAPHAGGGSRTFGGGAGRGQCIVSQRPSSSRSATGNKTSRIAALSNLQRSVSTTSDSDVSRTPSPKLYVKSGTDDSEDESKLRSKNKERKPDESPTDKESCRKATDTAETRSPIRTVPPRNNKSSMLRAASAREPAKVKPSFLSRSRSVSSIGSGSSSAPASPAKSAPRVWSPSSRTAKSKPSHNNSTQVENNESTCSYDATDVVDGTCTSQDNDAQATIDSMLDNTRGISPLSRNEPLNRTFVLDTMSNSQSSSSLSSPEKDGHKPEFTFSSDSLAECEPLSSTLNLENTSTSNPRLVPFAPVNQQTRMPFTPPPANNQPFVPPGDDKRPGQVPVIHHSRSLGDIPERATTPTSGQRRQWDISDKPVEDLMLSSINAFSAELRQAAESALVKVKSLYDSLESSEKASLEDELHPFTHPDNSKNDQSSIPDWKPSSAEIAGIFRNLRKVELRLRTMDHALSNMCVTAKIEEAKRDLDPSKASDHKWKDFKDEARKHSWIANQREDFAFTDSEDEDTA